MASGDLLSVAAGVGIVIILACITHPGWFSLPAAPEENTSAVVPPVPTIEVPQTPAPSVQVQRLTYVKNPAREYEVHLIPEDNVGRLEASDPPWQETNISVFASLEASRGGATETFTVPYPLWRINCTVENGSRPESAGISVLLVDAEDSTIVDGAEIRGPGTVIKNIEVSGKPYYLVVKTQNSDPFRITLETKTRYL
ncbi:hypothetical protein [uncultured Methanofollis sp.]|uniref:hypothetical protein n=1 Tax=uncultured Methanofollis sp. TaxID=262500 RepID=UPI002631AB8A|nr:hypothetical protein [uncultured Methanofollis sp.]